MNEKAKKYVDTLVEIEKSIYDEYKKLMKLEIDKKKNTSEYKEVLKKINLILSFEHEYLLKLFDEEDNLYLASNYLFDKYKRLNTSGDIEMLTKDTPIIHIKRLIYMLNEYEMIRREMLPPDEYTEIDIVNAEDMDDDEIEAIRMQVIETLNEHQNDEVIEYQIGREHCYSFLHELDSLYIQGMEDDLIKLKYRTCYLWNFLEPEMYENNFEIGDFLIHDRERERRLKNIPRKKFTTLEQTECEESVIDIVEDFSMRNDDLTFKDMIELYDMCIYYNTLNLNTREHLREALSNYEEVNTISTTAMNIIGKKKPIVVRINKKNIKVKVKNIKNN